MSIETQLVFLFEPRQFIFWREGEVPELGACMAYTLDAQGNECRAWWLWPVDSFVDGVELQPDAPPHTLIDPMSIKLNAPTSLWRKSDKRLNKKPQRLAERWTAWHNNHPRIVYYDSLYNKIKRFLS